MNTLHLRIRKKGKIKGRIAMVDVGTISYLDTYRLFKYFNIDSPIETDAQFAKLLYDSFGEGFYSVIAWQKRRQGFYSFISLHLLENGFNRVRKTNSLEDKEIKKTINEIRNKKKEYLKATAIIEKQEILREINELTESISDTREIKRILNTNKYGPYPYLKSLQPVYGFHGYQDYIIDSEDKYAKEVESFW